MNDSQLSGTKTTAAKNPVTLLPSPLELPQAEVVIYDGQCVFCSQQVANLDWFDGRRRLAYVSLHDPFVRKSYPDLSHDKMMEQIYLITQDHRRLGGAKALRHLSTKLPKLWIVAPLLHIPGSLPLWQFLYKQVAKYRYLIAGKQTDCDTSCEIHFGKKK